ncbi:aldo/keto reductase [Alteromonas halophila]|uniref:Aldo/keto reductase n=1 Tax=Alteromonas halophila TaxID=516698 RepID=A0A918JPZ3_9ALTE|nr:aldo/keto reductase [Alteromonas halophila]GGW92368.1 aldo/keto reductase [Alteromonas halophila]
MRYVELGNSELKVSEVCLGTMTWGIQNTQADADAQLDMALEHGINIIDTAEMYPVPPNKETYGDTERIIGNWLRRHPDKRSEVVIMSKVAGSGLDYIREGTPVTAKSLIAALDASLKRLQTDAIDVYQLHWPGRKTPHFDKHWPGTVSPLDINTAQETDAMRDILSGLNNAINDGKIRHWGLSNDTPWGIHTFLSLCREMNVPAPVSIQNEFSLLHAKDWPYLIEMCAAEHIAYLPWSPLATGMLSGKYVNGARPAGSRWTFVQRHGLFRDTDLAQQATQAYMKIARDAGMTPSQLALCWCRQVPGVTSTIIGATSLTQLEENIGAFTQTLTPSTLQQIGDVLKRYPLPF